jgi:hypothetical protein
MPPDFITLSEMPQAVLGITCDLCQRRESLDVEALKREHGGGGEDARVAIATGGRLSEAAAEVFQRI